MKRQSIVLQGHCFAEHMTDLKTLRGAVLVHLAVGAHLAWFRLDGSVYEATNSISITATAERCVHGVKPFLLRAFDSSTSFDTSGREGECTELLCLRWETLR